MHITRSLPSLLVVIFSLATVGAARTAGTLALPNAGYTATLLTAYQQPEDKPAPPSPAPRGQGQAQPPQPPNSPAGAQKSEQRRIDLGKFVSVATTPVGLIIAGAIIISFFQQKRIDASAQVRMLITEMRKPDLDDERRTSLVAEINVFKARLKAIQRGTELVAATIVFFVIANISSSLGLIWPKLWIFEGTVVAAMLLGMLTLGSSIALELYDSWRNGHEMSLELKDFDRLVKDAEKRKGQKRNVLQLP